MIIWNKARGKRALRRPRLCPESGVDAIKKKKTDWKTPFNERGLIKMKTNNELCHQTYWEKNLKRHFDNYIKSIKYFERDTHGQIRAQLISVATE